MAVYNNFSDVKDNADFLAFIQKEFGIANLSQIADYEQIALLMSFKSSIDDLSDADKEFLEEIQNANNKEDMEALKGAEFGTTRSFEQLTPAQQTYISVKNFDAKENGVSLEQIRDDLLKREQATMREQDELANYNSDLLYKDFDALIAESEGRVTNQHSEEVVPLIQNFLKKKDAYLKAHPEDRDEVNKYIDTALFRKEDDNQFSVSEYIRTAYTQEDDAFTAWMRGDDGNTDKEKPAETNTGNSDNNDNTGGPVPPLTVGVLEGQDNTNDKGPQNVTPGGNDNGGNDNNDKKQEMEEFDAREFQDNSDKNEARFDRLKYDILNEMGQIKNPLSAEDLQDQTKVFEAEQNALASLSEKDTEQFNASFAYEVVKAADNEQMLASVPPSVLTQVYKYYGEEIGKETDETKKNELTNRRDVIAKRIDRLTDEYYTGVRNIVRDNFNFDDNVNIADVYDGYKEMVEVRRPDVEAPQQAKIDDVNKKLDLDIADYDKDRGIADITKDNIDAVRANHRDLTKRFENIGLDDETMRFMNNVRFYDEGGQPIPQFVNPQTGQDALDWQSGFEIKSDSQLQTMVDFARNNTIIENMASDVKSLSDDDLQKAFQDRLKVQAFAWATAEEVTKNAIIEPDRFIDDKYLEDFKARMTDPNRPLKMSAEGFKAATQLSVNDTMGIIGRIAGKDHIDNPKDALLKRMYAPIEKYDARKGTRFNEKEEYNVNWFKTAAWTFGASLGQKLATYGATLGCVKAASALGLTTLSTGAAMTKYLPMAAGVTSMAMAGVGAYMNWKNYKKEAKANGQKPKVGEFLTKQPYATTNIASTLGFTAGACLMTGNVAAAAALGAGCLAVAGYGTYKDARKHGLNKKQALWQSLKKVSAIAVGGGLGSYVGSMLGVTPAYSEKGEGTPGHREDGPTTHNYAGNEHEHATNRLDDPRYSEFLERFHVAPDLQDSSDPNSVSSDAVTNLRAAITQAIGDDKQFYTDTAEPGQAAHYVPNTDVLGYKFEQLAYLAPNPDAPINPDYAANVLHVPEGTTVGEYLSMKTPDGQDMNYMDALKEIVSTGKSSNPEGLAAMLSKIENVVGMQIDDNVNDAGKITLFGTGPEAHPVQSFNENADAGYDLGKHTHWVPGKEGQDIMHGGDKLFGLGYWEPVKGLFGGMRKRIGSVADRVVSVFKPKPPVDKTPPKKPYIPPKVTIKIPEERKYLDEEYWMIHGYNPAERKVKGEDGKDKIIKVNPMLDPGYKAYVANADKERMAAGGKPWKEFLLERRAKMDGIIEAQTASYLGGHNARLNADILDPVGHKQVMQKQAELKAEGKKPMTKDEVDRAIKWPSSQELTDNYKEHRPTSKLCKIIRDAFWRKDNGVDVKDPKQRSTVEMDGKMVEGNKKVFSFNEFMKSAEDTLVRTTKETERDVTKAPPRRTLDEIGKMHRTKQSQH